MASAFAWTAGFGGQVANACAVAEAVAHESADTRLCGARLATDGQALHKDGGQAPAPRTQRGEGEQRGIDGYGHDIQ